MTRYEIEIQHQISSAAALLAASVSELSLCSTAAVKVIEQALGNVLSTVNPDQVKAVYAAIHAAFTERNDHDGEIIL